MLSNLHHNPADKFPVPYHLEFFTFLFSSTSSSPSFYYIMAFISVAPVTAAFPVNTLHATNNITRTHRPRVAMVVKPEPPKDFQKPQPQPFTPRPDKLLELASHSAGSFLRLGSGAFIEGYKLRKQSTTTESNIPFEEYSSTLPSTRPEKPLHLFQFDACPFCRKVREAVSILDLDVIVFPTPKGGRVYRQYVQTIGGKSQFPYIEDPNTDFSSYESDTIIKYLYETYGPSTSSPSIPFTLSNATLVSAAAATALRPGKGRERLSAKLVPAKKVIEVWSYEPSPFCKTVCETLNDLEIAYLLHTTPRGSPTRMKLKEITGRFQVPYIIDWNTGINMWESAEIADYLVNTYGPDAKYAVDNVDQSDVYMPGDPTTDSLEVEEVRSLDPQDIKDEKLEE